MSAVIGSLRAELSASIAKFQSDMGRAADSVKSIAKEFTAVGNDFKKVGTQMQSVGTALSKTITLPLAAIGIAAAKMSGDLNASMANISTLIPNSTKRIEELKSGVQDLAVAMGKSTSDMSGGLYELVSSLGDSSASLDILRINAKAAAAGLSSTQEAINFTTAVTKTYGDTSAAAFQKVSDLGFQAVNFGKTTFPELASAIGGVAPIAKVAGVSMEEMFAVIATATGVTGNTSEVVTQMASALTGLLSPSKQMSEAYKALGVTSGEALIAQKGFVGALQAVAAQAAKTQQPIIDLVGRKEAFILTASLAGAQASNFATQMQNMGHAAGATETAFKAQTQGINKLGFMWSQVTAQFQVVAQKLGDALAPALLSVTTAIQSLLPYLDATVKAFAAMPQGVQLAVIGVAAFAAALGPVLFIGGQIVSSLGAMALAFGKTGLATRVLLTALAEVRLAITAVNSLVIIDGVLYAQWGASTVTVARTFSGLALALKNVAASIAAVALAPLTVGLRSVTAYFAAGTAAGGALSLTLAGIASIASLAAAAFVGFKLGPMIGDWIGLSDQIEYASLKLQRWLGLLSKSATDADIWNAVQANTARRTGQVAEATQHAAESLQNLKDRLSGALATKSVDEITQAVRAFASAGTLTSDVMKRIAAEAVTLQQAGGKLTPELQHIVDGVAMMGKQTTTAQHSLKSLGEQVKDAVKELDGTKDPVKDAAKAIVKYRDEVDDLRKTLSGGAAIADLKKLADAFRGLPGAMRGNDEVLRRTAEAFEKLGDDLDVGKLPADLKTFAERMRAVTVESAAAANAENILARAGEHVGQVFGVFLITLEQMRNMAKGLTSQGLLPLAAGFDESATRAQKAAEAIRRYKEAIQDELAKPISLMPDLSGLTFGKVGLDLDVGNAKKDIDSLSGAIGSLSQDFTQLATIGGDAFSPVLRQVGMITKGVESVSKALDAMAGVSGGQGAASGANIGKVAALASAWVAVGVAVYQFISAQQDALNNAAAERGRVNAAQSLAAAYDSATLFSRRLTDSIAEQGKELEVSLNATTKYLGKSGALGREYAKGLNLPQIIEELGGFDAALKTSSGVLAHVGVLFDVFKEGGALAAQAAKVLDTVLIGIGESAVKTGGLVDQNFLGLVANARALGVELKNVSAFMSEQLTTNVVGGLSAFTAPAKAASDAFAKIKEQMAAIADERDRLSESRSLGTSDTQRLEALNKQWTDLAEQAKTQATIISALTIQSQGAADALAGTVAAAFGEMQKAGIPIIDIVNQLEPITAQLQKQFAEAGLSGGAAFERIQAFGVLAKDEIAGPVINAVIGLGKSLTGLHNVGLLNQETFSGLTSQISTSFAALQITGHGGADALALLQQPLQTIWALSTKFGLAVDEGTQALLDQAIAAGLVGEKQKPIQDQMLDATNRIADALDELVKGFGFLAPAAKIAADGIQTALNNIHAPTLTVPVNFVAGSSVTGPDGVEISPENSFARGSKGLRNFGSGTLAMLHGTEGVFTAAQLAEIQSVGPGVSQARSDAQMRQLTQTMDRVARYLTMDQANVLAVAVRDEVVKVKAYR